MKSAVESFLQFLNHLHVHVELKKIAKHKERRGYVVEMDNSLLKTVTIKLFDSLQNFSSPKM